jgi:hypothetical protein
MWLGHGTSDWVVSAARAPNTGTVYDEDMLTVPSTPGTTNAFAVSGTAADLDRWLRDRGDLGALERLTAIIASGVQ